MSENARTRWQARYEKSRVREVDFTTLSGLELEPAYGTDDSEWPGEFPFTRGLYPTGYRGRSWTIRQFAGFGNAQQTNERYRMILGRGGGGLSVAFDMPTLMGRDSDDPKSLGEVGHCGVAIDSAADMEVLFDGIDLGDVTTSMTISGPAVPVFCMMIVAAERAGVDTGKLNGTLQTDIFKEYIAQKEWIFGPEPHLRLIGDLMEYCAEKIPAYKPLSVSGYHIREAGSTAAQELAFTLADGFGYVELGLSRGLDVDVFAPGLSFFFDAHVDFFEEIAKFRAARRIWARWMRDVYGATTDKAQWLRFHTQTAGVSLTAQQPYNNVVRTGIEALSAVLGGTNSLHTNALDETLALPSEQAAEIALRTQQVIMEETGVVNVADPLGGSWYVEALTDRIEAEANAIFDQILAMGGSTAHLRPARADRRGRRSRRVARSPAGSCAASRTAGSCPRSPRRRSSTRSSLEKGEKRIVGVNCHTESVTHDLEILRVSHEVEVEQVRVLAARRQAARRRGRDGGAGRMVDGGARRREHDRADARRGARRGDARRDLRRAAGRVGRVPRTGPVLSRRRRSLGLAHDAAAVLPPGRDRPVRPQAPAPQPAAGGTRGRRPAAGGSSYAVEVTEENFQATIESSMTAPVLLVFYSPTRMPESQQLADDLVDAVDGVRGPVPGRPGRHRRRAGDRAGDADPVDPAGGRGPRRPSGAADPGRAAARRAALRADHQVMQQLTAQGMTGRHQPRVGRPSTPTATASPTSTRATPPPRTRSATVTSTARSRSTRSSSTPTPPTPRPPPAWRWPRSCSAPRASTSTPPGAAAAANPDDVDAQTMVADLDMLGGHVEDAFNRLIELVRRTSGDDRNQAREHLLGLFGAVGNDDPRVLKGRQSLASALF